MTVVHTEVHKKFPEHQSIQSEQKQWSDQNSVLYFISSTVEKRCMPCFSIMVNSGRGHTDCCCRDHRCLSSSPHAGCLLRPWFLWWKSSNPPSVWFFPALSAICSPLTLLSGSLRRCPLTGTVYLSAFETNFTHTCTTSCVADSHSTACVFLQGLNGLTAGFSLALWYIYKQYRVGLVMAECCLLVFFPLIIYFYSMALCYTLFWLVNPSSMATFIFLVSLSNLLLHTNTTIQLSTVLKIGINITVVAVFVLLLGWLFSTLYWTIFVSGSINLI